jgi:hypothetical protein
MGLGPDDVVGTRVKVAAAVKDLNTDVVLLDGVVIAIELVHGNEAEKTTELGRPPERERTENFLEFCLRKIYWDSRHHGRTLNYIRRSRTRNVSRPPGRHPLRNGHLQHNDGAKQTTHGELLCMLSQLRRIHNSFTGVAI